MSALGARIDGAWAALSPSERRVADFLRTRPDESALYNSSELARFTGVSKATVSRLYRRLGFAGSAEARDLLRTERTAGVPAVVDSPADPVAAHLAQDVRNLQRAERTLDRRTLASAAAALAAADRVLVVGLRSGAAPALLLRQALAQARDDVRSAPVAGQALAEELVGLGPADVLVVVAPRRRPSGVDAVLAAASAPVLLLTDEHHRADAARWVLAVPVRSPSAFDSLATMTSVAGLLASEVLRALGVAGAARVRGIAALYARLGELERDG